MPRIRPSKKDIERFYLDKFLAAKVPELPVRLIEHHETPDFVLRTENGTVSVEVMRLIKQETKVIEEFRNEIVRRAHEEFRRQSDRDLYCLVTMSNVRLHENARNRQINEYSRQLFEHVQSISSQQPENDFDVSLDRGDLKESVIERLHVRSSRGFDHWQHFGAHRVDWIDLEWLHERILQKEQKLRQYPEAYDSNWLLFLSNLGSKSSAHRYDFLDFGSLQTTFDKIFIYQSQDGSITVVK
jgi:hypothetical protein